MRKVFVFALVMLFAGSAQAGPVPPVGTELLWNGDFELDIGTNPSPGGDNWGTNGVMSYTQPSGDPCGTGGSKYVEATGNSGGAHYFGIAFYPLGGWIATDTDMDVKLEICFTGHVEYALEDTFSGGFGPDFNYYGQYWWTYHNDGSNPNPDGGEWVDAEYPGDGGVFSGGQPIYRSNIFTIPAGTINITLRFWQTYGNPFGLDNVSLKVVPEPATLGVLALGLVASFIRRRR